MGLNKSTHDGAYRGIFETEVKFKFPEPTPRRRTAATRLLQKQREMRDVDRSLAAGKQEFTRKMSNLQDRKGLLDTKEEDLKDYLYRFEKFIWEMEEKTGRAVRKGTEEKTRIQEMTAKIDQCREETRVLIATRDWLKKRSEHYVSCKDYLDKVLDASNSEFFELADIMGRHETLSTMLAHLKEGILEKQNVIAQLKYKLSKYKEAKSFEVMGYNNQLSQLTTRYDKAKRSSTLAASKWNYIKNTAAAKVLMMGRIKMATHNLYELVKLRRSSGRHTENTFRQLTVIGKYVRDLVVMVEGLKKSIAGTDESTHSLNSFQVVQIHNSGVSSSVHNINSKLSGS